MKREIAEMQAELRCREVGVNDCLELALAKERYNTFMETTKHIRILLKIGD